MIATIDTAQTYAAANTKTQKTGHYARYGEDVTLCRRPKGEDNSPSATRLCSKCEDVAEEIEAADARREAAPIAAVQPEVIPNDTAVICHSRGEIEGVVRSHFVSREDGRTYYSVEYDNGGQALNWREQLSVLDKEAADPQMCPFGGGVPAWAFTFGGVDYRVENLAEKGEPAEWSVRSEKSRDLIVTDGRTRKDAHAAALRTLKSRTAARA